MLFSREDVADVIGRNFEAAWEMVRPAPIVRIDFGNGNVVTRTLHGNVATHVCLSDGQVVDILPGIYTPAVYAAALDQLRRVADSLRQADAQQQTRLLDYHRAQAQLLRNPEPRIAYPRAALNVPNRANAVATQPPNRSAEQDRGKKIVERRIEQIVVQPATGSNAASAGRRPPPNRNLAEWDALAVDTWINESQRRLQIHDELVRTNPVRPEQIKRWLYRDVLQADLDDPYLGLGDALLGDDVFREAEA